MILGKQLDLKAQKFSNICLLSTPLVACSYFGKSIVYIFSHTKDKTIGFTINKQASTRVTNTLKEKTILKILPENTPIYCGGPVNENLVTVLHSSEYKIKNTLNVGGSLSLTENQTIIEDIANNKGPEYYMILQGCSTWVKNQLAKEIEKDSWISLDFDKTLITKTSAELWNKLYSQNNLPVLSPTFVSSPNNKELNS